MPVPKALLNTLRITALTLGSIITLVGVAFSSWEGWFQLHAAYTQGNVVAIKGTTDARGKQAICPRIIFQATNGGQYAFTSKSCSSAKTDWGIGKTVPVEYRRDNPNRARIAPRTPLWLIAMGVTAAGLVVLYAGLALEKARRDAEIRTLRGLVR